MSGVCYEMPSPIISYISSWFMKDGRTTSHSDNAFDMQKSGSSYFEC